MRVVVCDPIHEVGLDALRNAGMDLELASEYDETDLDAAIARAEALIVRSGTTVTAARIEAADELQVIARAGIGVDNIDLEAASDAGVQVVNAPTGGVGAVTEHTIALAYALVRELAWTDRQTRDGEWPKGEYDGDELRGSTLGIIGLGNIGQSVAKRAAQLGLDIVGYDPYVSDEVVEELEIARCDFETCFDLADIVTVHTPLTPETEGLVDATAFEHLGNGYLINCSRGGVVDEDALVESLESGQLAGAAVDVYEEEPIDADHPLAACERTLLTPHIAGTSDRAQRTIATSVAEQIIAVTRGDAVEHPVNEPA